MKRVYRYRLLVTAGEEGMKLPFCGELDIGTVRGQADNVHAV
jgi:hypothetical protein